MAGSQKRKFDFETVEPGEALASYEYVLSQEMLDKFRAAVEDPDSDFPTIGIKHDTTAFEMVFQDDVGGVNAGAEVEFHNPPILGKKIMVTARITDKFWRREKPYLVYEATAIDEDGRLLEKMRTFEVKKPIVVKEKWWPES
jgi:hypothetical protein